MLTIGIPTYNRKEQLVRTLGYLKNQTNQNFNIVISDNNSDYDIFKAIEDNFEYEFRQRIRIRKRSINVGADNNIVGMFELVDNGWLWIIGDDDVESSTAVETINKYMKQYSECAVILFSLFAYLENNVQINDIHKFVDSIYNNINKNNAELICGDFCSVSNKIYNMEIIKKYVDLAFEFSTCCMTTGLVMLNAIMNSEECLFVVGESLILSGDKATWNVKKISLAAQSLANIRYGIEEGYRRKLLYIINIPYRMPLHYWLMPENHYDTDQYIERMYYGFYRYHLPLKERFDYWLRMKAFSLDIVYKLHLWLQGRERNLKNKRR